MTLASLKKRAPSVKRTVVSVDDFIADAEFYAKGMSKVVTLPNQRAADNDADEPLKRATFTLGEQAIEQLTALSEETGIAKSRLIRIWLANESDRLDLMAYITSPVK